MQICLDLWTWNWYHTAELSTQWHPSKTNIEVFDWNHIQWMWGWSHQHIKTPDHISSWHTKPYNNEHCAKVRNYRNWFQITGSCSNCKHLSFYFLTIHNRGNTHIRATDLNTGQILLRSVGNFAPKWARFHFALILWSSNSQWYLLSWQLWKIENFASDVHCCSYC